MPIVESYAKLREMTDEQLIELYNRNALSSDMGVAFFREEIQRREDERKYKQMCNISRWMLLLTIAITVLTVVNVGLVAVTMCASIGLP